MKKPYKPKKIKDGVRGTSMDIDALYKKKKRPLPRLAIKEEIEASGLSYGRIAEILGVKHAASIHKIAHSQNPNFSSLKQIAFALEIPVSRLIKD